MSQIYKVGTHGTDTPGDIKAGWASPSAINNYDVFKIANASYIVTAGKTFLLAAVRLLCTAANAEIRLHYGTTAIVDAAGPPAAAVLFQQVYTLGAAYVPSDLTPSLSVPASNYPHTRLLTATVTYAFFSGLEY